MNNEVTYDPALCIDFAKENRNEMLKSKKAACFGCFSSCEAGKVKYSNNTAVCPYCGKKMLIPDSSGAPIGDYSFIERMRLCTLRG